MFVFTSTTSLVFGRDQEEHNDRLRKVLHIIREHGLSLNLSKCSFNKREISYLGHLIEDGNVRPDPARTEAVLKQRVPRTVAELEKFLGMVNYFRSFVPHFAELSRELYCMAKRK